MEPETLDLIKTFTPWVFSGASLAWIVLHFMLRKTYAKQEDLQMVKDDLTKVKSTVSSLPGQKEFTDLRIELSDTKAEVRELRAELKPVHHLAQLLLENELKGEKKS